MTVYNMMNFRQQFLGIHLARFSLKMAMNIRRFENGLKPLMNWMKTEREFRLLKVRFPIFQKPLPALLKSQWNLSLNRVLTKMEALMMWKVTVHPSNTLYPSKLLGYPIQQKHKTVGRSFDKNESWRDSFSYVKT